MQRVKILISKSVQGLEDQINEGLQEGWKRAEPMITDKYYYYQVMEIENEEICSSRV